MWSITKSALTALAVLALTATSHPGHDIKQDAAERAEFIKRSTSLGERCGAQLAARGVEQRTRARRQALAESLRKKRSIDSAKPYLKARDVDTVLATDHHSNMTGVTLSTPEYQFFDNSSCLLQSETTQGPYWVSGEYIRPNIIETQPGIPLTLTLQLIDTATCSPIPHAYVEFWHCNSTGVYSGVVASGNGNSNDASNLNATFLRGIQPTDELGVVRVDTIFPGHYTGRTTHVHILSHSGGKMLNNATLAGGNVTHVGQLFFDQSLISQVEQTSPYSLNTQTLTTNEEDMILSQEADTTDPVVEYVLLGDTVEEGLFGWISVGVDVGNAFNISAAATLTGNGGVVNPNAGAGGPGGPPGNGTGTAPTGAPPSGTPPA